MSTHELVDAALDFGWIEDAVWVYLSSELGSEASTRGRGSGCAVVGSPPPLGGGDLSNEGAILGGSSGHAESTSLRGPPWRSSPRFRGIAD
ncbi:hypothetical protein [Nocardioides caldifontis]|uniref:hypothetical protein n=1 Tax=Nocardioides caldifontis TaxID=2588938 RepID=UPI00139681B0|nr:hypothetical protein [Nocardioides caldifontis]